MPTTSENNKREMNKILETPSPTVNKPLVGGVKENEIVILNYIE